jgi:hypothetical protein
MVSGSGILTGGNRVRWCGAPRCSFVGSWVVDVLGMRVGACADELRLDVVGPGRVVTSCLGGVGGHAFWVVSGLVSLFRLCIFGPMVGCMVVVVSSVRLGWVGSESCMIS